MDDFRSKSCGHGRMQAESYYGGGGRGGGPTSTGGVNGMQDLRCYSASYASSVHAPPQQQNQVAVGYNNNNNGDKYKKGKSGGWSLGDPELQRKKRVASYKVYTVEGKVKGSFRKSFRWLKETCNRVVYGRHNQPGNLEGMLQPFLYLFSSVTNGAPLEKSRTGISVTVDLVFTDCCK